MLVMTTIGTEWLLKAIQRHQVHSQVDGQVRILNTCLSMLCHWLDFDEYREKGRLYFLIAVRPSLFHHYTGVRNRLFQEIASPLIDLGFFQLPLRERHENQIILLPAVTI
jgi:hypothetical protein